MLAFLAFLTSLVTRLFSSRQSLVIENAVLRKEAEILKRRLQGSPLRTARPDRIMLSVLHRIYNIRHLVTIIKPETVLKWQRNLTKSFWAFNKKYYPGRPPVPTATKDLILEMKNSNLCWGYARIQGELAKLGIDLATKTIANVLRHYRTKGHGQVELELAEVSQGPSLVSLCDGLLHGRYNSQQALLCLLYHQPCEQGNCSLCRHREPGETVCSSAAA